MAGSGGLTKAQGSVANRAVIHPSFFLDESQSGKLD